MKKEKWIKPKLIIISRNKPEECVLCACFSNPSNKICGNRFENRTARS